VIAYEPVWAIGTGKTATPEIAADAHRAIRAQVRGKFGKEAADAIRILYGGSVKPDNAKILMAQPEIDGVLVGGARHLPGPGVVRLHRELLDRFRKDEVVRLVEQRLNLRLVAWQKLYSSFVYLRKLMELLETPPRNLPRRLR
jgi:hypothetical protein